MRYFKANKTEIREHKRRLAIAVITAIAGVVSLPAPNCLAGKPSHGPIYRTLDALAGGMEKVIGIAASARRGAAGCDAQSCDDGCDALTLQELDAASEYDSPIYPDARVIESSPHANAMEPTVMPRAAEPLRAVAPRSPMPVPRSNPNRSHSVPQSQSKPTPLREPQPLRQPSPIPRPMRDTQPMLEPKPEKMLEPMSIPQPLEEGWFDNLTPAPNSGELRNPAERTDTLDPFRDDLQGRKKIKSANQPASYWEPW